MPSRWYFSYGVQGNSLTSETATDAWVLLGERTPGSGRGCSNTVYG